MSAIFKPGKITFVLDGGAGSSAKGARGAYIWKHLKQDHTKFAMNTFMSNAAHTITHDSGKEMVHQCLSSITTLGEYERQYISPGAVFSLEEIETELAKCEVGPELLGIHPNAVIVTQKDIDYERGLVDFEGNKKDVRDSINLHIGSTLHGVGAARARRVLRRPDVTLVKDAPSLRKYLCQTQSDVMKRLTAGESGLGEIAQGYQLSLMSSFYPRTTSRNCSVAAFLDDSLLPVSIAGPVVVNFRTFPIRVNNNKYVRKSDGKILTWDEYNNMAEADRQLIKGDSGECYPDQRELTWDEISAGAGEKIFETTSLTKLPRRVFTFSKISLQESLLHNNTGDDVYISVNFMNYVDATVKSKRTIEGILTPKVKAWIRQNIIADDMVAFYKQNNIHVRGLFLGTWRSLDDSAYIDFTQI